MIIIDNFSQVAAQIESERGVSKLALIDAIEQALISACRRKTEEGALLESKIDHMTGEAKIWQLKKVVKDVENPIMEISLKEAKKLQKNIQVEDFYRIDITPSDFGRIAAQTAKQVIIQRIREAEKVSIYDEFKTKEHQIITGTVQQIERKNYLINLGRIETMLVPQEQIIGEQFNIKDRVKLYVSSVKNTAKGPQIQVSRSHPGLLRKLFEMEIPEIQDGLIEIVSVAREPGKRAKVAVKTNNQAVGAVGTCVGHMGSRIQSIIRELGNEKIDILDWDEDPKNFIANSLKPAKIKEVIIPNKEEKEATVVVAKDQLSLAIGKVGINVRLAVKLTGWKINILTDDSFSKEEDKIRQGNQLSMMEKIKRDSELLKQEEEKERQKLAELNSDEMNGVAETLISEGVTEEVSSEVQVADISSATDAAEKKPRKRKPKAEKAAE